MVMLLDRLERKLEEFDAALTCGPSAVDRARGEYLEMLAQYADRLAARVAEELAGSRWSESWSPGTAAVGRAMLSLAVALRAKTEGRARRTWDGRFAWAAADGRQIRQHHLVGLRRMLTVLPDDGIPDRPAGASRRVYPGGPVRRDKPGGSQAGGSEGDGGWLQAEADAVAVVGAMEEWKARLDPAWNGRGPDAPLTADQDDVLRQLLARVPRGDGVNVLRSPLRKAILAELGRRGPSAAYRVACHLWARDLADLCPDAPDLAAAAERWGRGDEWACAVPLNAVREADGTWSGEAVFVPAGRAAALLLLVGGRPVVVPAAAPEVRIEALDAPGLRGAGLARVRVKRLRGPLITAVNLRPAWGVLSSADLTSIAAGLADELCRRAVAQATTSVQFPGLFHDEEGRDAIGKFGAVKRRVGEVAAHRYVLETIDHTLTPTGFEEEALVRAGLMRVLTAEVLGAGPGGVAFNVGQLFGRAGLAEEPSLASLLAAASLWRFLGTPCEKIYTGYGRLTECGVDPRRVVEANGDFEEVLQRQALRAEVEAVRRLEARGQALARDREKWPASSDFGAGEAEMTEGLARQSAYLLAGKALLLRTHARLEEGLDCAVEAPLLRVWLDEADVLLDEFAGCVQRRLDSPRRYDERPLVEPGAGPPVSSPVEYRVAAASYESGDFLVRPVDLLQPRLVPEAGGEADPRWPAVAAGRAGHLLAAVDALRKGMGRARALAAAGVRGGAAGEGVAGGMAWRLQRMEEDLFVAEALAFDVSGRGMHPGTKSLRMEWLIARMLLAELRHRVGESFADLCCMAESGGGCADDLHLCTEVGLPVDERRNARRRFFLLKDLVTEVGPRWARDGSEGPKHLGREVLELEALKVQFRQRLEAARELFGHDLWRNPNLQANCLALSEVAAWLLAADSTLGRAAWQYRHEGDEGEELSPGRELGLRALARCYTEVRDRLRRFDEDLTQLRRGFYAPHVRAASLLFNRATER
jgi:hypothetical protein